MGYVHHASYIYYLEEARMSLFNSVGLDVVELENQGIILPVVQLDIRYLSPLHYSDQIMVHVSTEAPWQPRLEFNYSIYKKDHTLASRARNSLVFAKKDSGRLIADPQKYLACFKRASIDMIHP